MNYIFLNRWHTLTSRALARLYGGRNVGLFGLVALLGAGTGWLSAAGLPLVPFALLVVAGAWEIGLRNWRAAVLGLVIFTPFASLPVIAFPHVATTRLAKDLLFVLPAYTGFAIWWAHNRRRVPLSLVWAPVGLMAALVAILLIQCFNPALVSSLVALIGLRGWVLYMPLFFLGYYLINSKERLFQLANWMLWIATIPVLIGLAQAGLVYSGRADLAYAPYGELAAAMTQNFVALSVGADQTLVRIPSTFTFVMQYWTFLLAMLPLSYALWDRARRDKRRAQWWLLLLMGLIVLAGLSSGARAALMQIPLLFLLVVILTGYWRNVVSLGLVMAAGFTVMASFLGLTPIGLLLYARGIVAHYLGSEGIIREHLVALNLTWIGMGTGMSTGPARFAFPDDAVSPNLVGLESFYAKTIVELGVPGLLIVMALFTRLLISGYARLRSVRADPALRAFAGALLAYLLVIVIYLTKGAVIDYDPSNVYFWLFAGILMKLPHFQQGPERLSQRATIKPVSIEHGN